MDYTSKDVDKQCKSCVTKCNITILLKHNIKFILSIYTTHCVCSIRLTYN